MIGQIDIFMLRVPKADARAAPLETVILRLVSDDGAEGVGECATAPAFDGVRAEAVQRDLENSLTAPLAEDALEKLLPRLTPHVRCAADIALCDLRGRRRGIRAADLLGGCRIERVPVNALLASDSGGSFLDTARAAWARGIRTFKIKSSTPGEDSSRLEALRACFGGEARLRVDAGGRWTQAEARSRLRALRAFDLDYVEQPLGPGDLAAMAVVAREAGIAVAADEDATDAEAVREIAALGAASLVIVKLPPAGGMTGAVAMIEAARACGLGAVVTGMMDTSVGLAAALHVAARAGSLAGACGLGTLELLAADVVRDPLRIEAGEMILPPGPGLGVILDPGAIARLRADRRSANG